MPPKSCLCWFNWDEERARRRAVDKQTSLVNEPSATNDPKERGFHVQLVRATNSNPQDCTWNAKVLVGELGGWWVAYPVDGFGGAPRQFAGGLAYCFGCILPVPPDCITLTC